MATRTIYTVGGTVQAGGGVYIPRQADVQLLDLCRRGEFAYILTARQMGKSSLMVRTAERLAKEGICAAMVDLTGIGVQVTSEQWYLGLLTRIEEDLELETDVAAWWQAHDDLGFVQRLTLFFEQVLLAEIPQQVVVFVDEIDSTLNLDFTDDFYAAIRYLYNARTQSPAFRRLSFVLIGVATPGDLIADPKRTPFNIGQRVDLTDFTPSEATPLADGLDLPAPHDREVLQWILNWTGGHPYLTQRLCCEITVHKQMTWTQDGVAAVVTETFFGEQSEQDNNLQFVRDMLTQRSPDLTGVLGTYRDIRLGRRPVPDEGQSLIKNHLKLSGIVRREEDLLRVRNPIYERVFDRRWIKTHWSVSWFATIPRPIKISAVIILVLLVALAVLAWNLQIQVATAVAAQETAEAEAHVRGTAEVAAVAAKAMAVAAQATTQANAMLAMYRAAEAEAARATAQAEVEARITQVSVRSTAEAEALAAQATLQIAVQSLATEVDIRSTAEANAVNARLTAEAERENAQQLLTLQLVAQARQAIDEDQLSKGLLLAIEAINTATQNKERCSEAEELLHNALAKADQNVLRGHQGTIYALDISPDSHWLATGSADSTVRVWDLFAPTSQAITLYGHESSIYVVTISSSGKWLATGSKDRTVRLWDLAELTSLDKSSLQSVLEEKAILYGHGDSITALAFSQDERWLATSSFGDTARLWNIDDLAAPPILLQGHRGSIRDIAFFRNGDQLVTGSSDRTARVWRRLSSQAIESVPLTGHTEVVRTLAISPDEYWLATGSDDRTIRLWNLSNLTNEPTLLNNHSGRIYQLTFSPDGHWLIAGDDDHIVYLWDWDNPQVQPIMLTGHDKAITALAVSSDSRWLATGSLDDTVRLWDLDNPDAQPVVLVGHKSDVSTLDISPDGRLLVSGGVDSEIRLWYLQLAELENIACLTAGRNLTVEEWNQFLLGQEYRKTCEQWPLEKE